MSDLAKDVTSRSDSVQKDNRLGVGHVHKVKRNLVGAGVFDDQFAEVAQLLLASLAGPDENGARHIGVGVFEKTLNHRNRFDIHNPDLNLPLHASLLALADKP